VHRARAGGCSHSVVALGRESVVAGGRSPAAVPQAVAPLRWPWPRLIMTPLTTGRAARHPSALRALPGCRELGAGGHRGRRGRCEGRLERSARSPARRTRRRRSPPRWHGGRGGSRTASVSPVERERETAVHVGTVLEIARTHGTWESLFQHDVLLSAQRFQHGIEARAATATFDAGGGCGPHGDCG